MSEQIPELQAAKDIVETYWRAEVHKSGSIEAVSMLHEVVHSRPEDLLGHYEAIMKILKKAIRTIKEQKNEPRN